MMRNLTRSAPFIITLFLGFQSVALADYLVANYSPPNDADVDIQSLVDDATLVEPPMGVRVSYNGTYPRTEHGTSTLRFLIYNGSSRELTCIGYGGRCASPEIRLRGLDAKAWVCMNGSSHYTIKPGESAELMVSASDFNLLPGGAEEVLIGYEFDHSDGRSDEYFAEPIILPAEFRKAVRKYLDEISEY